MELHYKQYPPKKRYIYVSNFLQDLYTLYQNGCDKKLHTYKHIALYSAIETFLTRIYPSQLTKEKDISSIQYIFILPSQEYTSKDFIDNIWLPLLQKTPWVKGNFSNKTKFYNRFQCLTYYLNKQIELQREHIHLIWILQCRPDSTKLLVNLAPVRMVYDPELVAASRKSIANLGENALLSAKLLYPTALFEIPIHTRNEKVDELANFLYMKVFADQERKSNHAVLDEYYTDSNNESLIHQLISAISKSFYKDKLDWEISVEHFINSNQMDHLLTNENKSRLSLIKYNDVLQYFDDSRIFFSIRDEVLSATQKYCSEENFHNVIAIEEDEWRSLAKEKEDHKGSPGYNFAVEHCRRFYLIKAQSTIHRIVKGTPRCKNSTTWSYKERNLTDGCAYKILNMVELSSKIKQPIVVKSFDGGKDSSIADPVTRYGKFKLINQIQPYGYYVEANININNKIKMSLNQVIETADCVSGIIRSTLPISNVCCKATGVYEFILDRIWETITRNVMTQKDNATHQYEMTMKDSYELFKSSLTGVVKNCMESASANISDLDEIIYNHESNSMCSISISHRFLMDVGLLPYLRTIAIMIVSSLAANAMFGKYEISCLVITGEFLYKWLEQYNPTYGSFIWNHLKSAIYSALNSNQSRTQLTMTKPIVFEDNICNYQPLKLEVYQQIFSKHYFVFLSFAKQHNVRVHLDKGNHLISLPYTTEGDRSIWKIPVSHSEEEGALRPILKDKLYISLDPERINQLNVSLRLMCLSGKELDDLDEAMSSQFNVALLVGHNIFNASVESIKNRISFPLEVEIQPTGYLPAVELKMRMGIDTSLLHNALRFDHTRYPERLTLQLIRSK
ncbi:hypothetical protein PS15p_208275 [Mucor circinelloides]